MPLQELAQCLGRAAPRNRFELRKVSRMENVKPPSKPNKLRHWPVDLMNFVYQRRMLELEDLLFPPLAVHSESMSSDRRTDHSSAPPLEQ